MSYLAWRTLLSASLQLQWLSRLDSLEARERSRCLEWHNLSDLVYMFASGQVELDHRNVYSLLWHVWRNIGEKYIQHLVWWILLRRSEKWCWISCSVGCSYIPFSLSNNNFKTNQACYYFLVPLSIFHLCAYKYSEVVMWKFLCPNNKKKKIFSSS